MNLKKLNFLSVKTRRKIAAGTLSIALGLSFVSGSISSIVLADENGINISNSVIKAFADEVSQNNIKKIIDIDLYGTTFILKNDGTVYKNCISNSNKLSVNNVKDIIPIYAKYYTRSVFFLTNSGEVYAYGENDTGQLGLGDIKDRLMDPVKVNISNVRKIVIGCYKNVYFIKSDNTVFVCGNNVDGGNDPGLLGIGNIRNITKIPTQIDLSDIKDVIPSGANVFYLTNTGKVYITGCQHDEPYLFFTNAQINKIITVDSSDGDNGRSNPVFFLMNDDAKSVYVYGENSAGELGTGNDTRVTYPTKINISNIKDIAASFFDYGCSETVFLTYDGSVYTCGNNNTIKNYSLKKLAGVDTIDQFCFNYMVKRDGTLVYLSDDHTLKDIKYPSGGNVNISDIKDGCFDPNDSLPKLLIDKNNILYFLRYYRDPENVTSLVYNKTRYTIDKMYNADDQSKYGSWFTGYYSKSLYDNNDLMQFVLNNTDGTATLSNGGVIKDDSQIKNKYFLSNGSMILIDNYGMVQYYENLTTTEPATLPIDGSGIIGADTLVFGSGTSAVQHPVLYFGSSSKYIDTDGSLKTFTLKKNDVSKMFAYKYKKGVSQYMLIEKSDGSLVYLDSNGKQQDFGLNMNDVSYIMPATNVNKDIFVMKDGTLRDDKGVVSMPDGVTLKTIWSNRVFEMSDGFLYTFQDRTFKNTNTLATFAKLAQNNALLLKNGNFQLADTSGKLTNDLDVSGNDVKYMSQLDSTNMYLILNDGTTYGVGDKVQGDSLENHGVKISDVSAFLSNGSDNAARALVTKDGTVYTNPGSWTKNTLVHFSSDAVTEAHGENPVYTNPQDVLDDYKNSKDPGIINKLPGGTDEKGEISNGTNPSDTTSPSIDITGNPTEWTNKSVTLSVTASDETGGSGIASITMPDGSTVTSGSGTYKVTKNGTYTFKATDKAGNVTTKEITVYIDTATPTAPIISNNNGTVTITAGADSESGVKETDYSIDGGAYQRYTVPFTLDTGSHTVKAKTIDNAGNVSREISQNITIGASDTTSPSIDVTENQTNWTNKSVTLSVTASDETGGSGIASITMPDSSTVTAGSGTYKVTKNGTYIFKATDKAGNVTTKEVTVSNIDTTAPTAPIISNNNGTITITAGTDSESGVKDTDYSIDGGAYQRYTIAFILDSGSHIVKAKTVDNAGNISNEATVNVTVDNQDMKNAQDAVDKAWQTLDQDDLDKAKKIVDGLPDGKDKDNLGAQIGDIQNKIDNKVADKALEAAEAAVVKAEKSLKQSDVDSARALVDKLSSGKDKTDLGNRLDDIVLNNTISAIDKDITSLEKDVNNHIAYNINMDIDSYKEKVSALQSRVDALPDSVSNTKTSFSNRLNEIENKLKNEQIIQNAIKKVENALDKAGKTLDKGNIDDAQKAIDDLPSSIDKTKYNNELRTIKQELQAQTAKDVTSANAAVMKVSRTKSLDDLNTARSLVDKLPDSSQKTQLTNQLNIIARFCK